MILYLFQVHKNPYRGSRPDSLKDQNSIKSGRSIEAPSEEAVPDSPIAKNKDEGILSRATKMVTGGGEPPWSPSYWNDSKNVYRANCYGYMLDRISTNTWDPYCGLNFQPGYRTGNYYTALTKSAIIKAVKSDMKKAGRTFVTQEEVHKALGKPSSALHGARGDVYILENKTKITIYFDMDGMVDNILITNKDDIKTFTAE